MKNVVRGRFRCLSHLQYAPCRKFSSSSQSLQDSIQSAINSKSYTNLPDLLTNTSQNPNPFSFLSTLTLSHRLRVIDEILQSLLSLRPRSRSHIVYSSLLSFTLHSPSPFPLSLAIIQSTLRAGTSPPLHLLRSLSSAWLQYRENSRSVSSVLLELESLGYRIDCGTCNYVIESLCYVDQVVEARIVLEGMVKAGCVPDSESYGVLIAALCRLRRGREAVELMKEMVGKIGLSPRERSVVKVLSVLKANKDVWNAVELIEFLEEEECCVGFGAYELVLEGCVHWEEFVLGAKLAVRMVEKGFIPYVKVRHRLVEGLAGAGEWGLACSVRQRFAELNS